MFLKYLSLLVCLGLIGGVLFYWQRNHQFGSEPPEAVGKLQITASFYPLYYFAQTIVGDRADVYNLTPAGAEPHDYEPTPQDIVRLQNSQVVIVNGGVEPWVDKVKEDLLAKHVSVLQTGEGLLSRRFIDEENHAVQDPHIWLSPRLAGSIVERIEETVAARDPAHASDYHERALALKQKLMELDTQFIHGLQGCRERQFVTSHSAFGYLAAEYGLTQIGIAGLSPEAEPSPQALGEIATFAKQNKIQYIFFESLVSPKLANTLAREVGAQTLVLNPLEGLTPEETSNGKDYFSEMQTNLDNLRLALACPIQTPTK